MSGPRRSHLTPLVAPPTSGAAIDARWDREHGTPVTVSEARRRAERAAADPNGLSVAAYWDDYAAEVEGWTA